MIKFVCHLIHNDSDMFTMTLAEAPTLTSLQKQLKTGLLEGEGEYFSIIKAYFMLLYVYYFK